LTVEAESPLHWCVSERVVVGRRRLVWTTLERLVRRSVDACFARAKQSRQQSDGSLLTLVRTGSPRRVD
jgi:hypothetical protein